MQRRLLFVTLLLSTAASAQIDEARKSDWDKASRTQPLIVGAVKDGKADDAIKYMDESKLSLDKVQDKLDRAGSRIDDEDKKWLGTTKKQEASRKSSDTRISGGFLVSALRDKKDPSSALSEFNNNWNEFVRLFDSVWVDYQKHAKELQERLKKFQDDCRACF